MNLIVLHVKTLEASTPFLKTIKKLSEKYRLFIVSNCQDGYIELTMNKNNIQNFITDWECYGHSGLEKWENIRLITERNSLKHPVYVGDTEGDLEACEKAGVPFIWASYGFGANLNPKRIIAKIEFFSQLESIL